jgi:phage terminase large subunit
MDIVGMDIIAGLDWGFKDATAMVVLAYSWAQNKFFLLDEYYESERTTQQHAEAIREKLDHWGGDFVFIDSAAAQTKYDLAQNYDISCTNAKKSVLDGIGYVSSIIDNGNLIIHNGCRHTLKSIDQYQWDDRQGLMKEKPKHNEASHIADALRYAMYSFETSTNIM